MSMRKILALLVFVSVRREGLAGRYLRCGLLVGVHRLALAGGAIAIAPENPLAVLNHKCTDGGLNVLTVVVRSPCPPGYPRL